MRVTGERIVTSEGGFNASWQRHSACYAFAARFLHAGNVLDLGCGTGHAHRFLKSRKIVGMDLDARCLEGQSNPCIVGDMRALPFADDSFANVLCIHAVEHVPDPRPVISEAARVLRGGGTAVFVTPNRLTFAMPDEIIDPYHFVEYDHRQLQQVCTPHFGKVEMFGLFGSERYMEFFESERRQLRALLRKDPLRLRRAVPRKLKRVLYDLSLSRARLGGPSAAGSFELSDFELRSEGLDASLDLMAVCRL